MNRSTRSIVWGVGVVLSLILIIGAMRDLPASARGLVTAENDILIDRLAEQVGERELMEAVLNADIADEDPELRAVGNRIERSLERRDERRDGRKDRRVGNRRDGNRRDDRDSGLNETLTDAFDDALERIGPDAVYQVVVDAGLLTQTEANNLLGAE